MWESILTTRELAPDLGPGPTDGSTDSRQHLAARDACTSRSHRSTTPEPPAAVSLATPEPPAAVIASTPEPRSTTPEATAATYSVVVPNAETGVQDPAMTGVQDPRVSGVQDARDGGTGHEERGSQYPTSEVLSEASSDVVLSRSEMVTIGKRLVTATHRAKSAQIAEHIGAAVTRYGRASVTDALVTLESLPERFPWPEKLADAIDAHIAEMAHRRREKATRDMHDDDQLDADEGMYHLSPMSPLSLDRDRRDRSDTTLTLLPGGEG